MTGLLDQGFGMEALARATLVVLMRDLNDELAAQEAAWADADEALALARGEEPAPIPMEPVEPRNFHLGNVPSLLEETTPKESYPNVAVMAYRSGPGGAGGGDHFAEYSNAVYVETMVKASPEEGEEVCDRRVWRTAEAINNVIQRSGDLGGLSYDLGPEPQCLVSEVFERPENPREGHGPKWYWQAARIEYTVSKYSPFGR